MTTSNLPSVSASILAALLVSIAVPIAANHSQTESGRTVTFDHKTGNEWWVEVTLAGPDAATPTKVEGMDTGGAWTNLPKQSWGAYAASFHIEPGHQVRFRATWSDGDVVNSCWFTHPAGAEQCSTTTSTTTTTTSSTTTTTGTGTFDATFTGVRGNEWWIQASVATNGPAVSKVDVRLFANNAWGNYLPVAKQSWGWGSSYHIVQGTIVQLRATAADGQTDTSSCRQWIPPSGADAAIVTCPGGGGGGTNVWNRKVLYAHADSYPTDLAIGDADRDGKSETYVAEETGLVRITAAGTSTVSPLTGFVAVAVGDGDNDGQTEVYASRIREDFAGSELIRFSWSGSAWSGQIIHADAEWMGAVTIGDVDVFGGRDVYVARSLSAAGQVLQVHWSSPSSQWLTDVIADFGDDGSFLDVTGLWIANLDGDSNLELAAVTGGRGYGNGWIVDHGPPAPNVPSQWRTFRLEAHASYGYGVTAGDADGDGKTELILGSDNGLTLFRFAPGPDPYSPTWTKQDIDLAGGRFDPFFGDGDNDGLPEVYSGSGFLGLQVHKTAYRNGAWSDTAIGALVGTDPSADRIVVGDSDGNGKREVLVATYDYGDTSQDGDEVGRVLQFSFGPPVTQPTFDATFSGVSGNQWWVQANVAANEPLLKVEARVNCGQVYKELTKQSWGGWAASFQIADGARVTFRATSWDGDTDVSGGYIWPSATPTAGC